MPESSLEKAMSLTTQVNKIGFVEFTTDLVKNVYGVIVEASMDQLRQFADLVKDVSKPLSEYQNSIGLGTTNDPAAGSTLLANCQRYAQDVLNFTLTSDTPPKYKLDGSSNDQLKERRNAIVADLQEHDLTDQTPVVKIATLLPEPASGTEILLDDTGTTNLNKIIGLRLRKSAEDNYNLLVTILKLGMQKIVVDRGLIATKLTFHVDASESTSKAASDVNIKSKSFNLGGSISGGFKKIGGKIGGGYSSTNLSVSVVNEKSSSVANMTADIVGEVRIEFRTDSFPSIE